MKTFETPVVDVKKFDVMDVLTASGESEETEEPEPEMEFLGDTCMSL